MFSHSWGRGAASRPWTTTSHLVTHQYQFLWNFKKELALENTYYGGRQDSITSRHTELNWTEPPVESILDCNHPEKNSGQGSSLHWKQLVLHRADHHLRMRCFENFRIFDLHRPGEIFQQQQYSIELNSCNHCLLTLSRCSQFQVDCAL